MSRKLTYPDLRIFSGGFRVTQFFGSRPTTYRKYGFNGHEGLDVIPLKRDWSIYAPEDGKIVRDTDDPRSFNNYGNLTVLLSTDGRRAWWFAHNVENYVSIGQKIKKGDKIAKTGATGNVTGAHLHLGLREAVGGRAINTNNGYKGFVDPLPFLQKITQSMPGKYTEDEVTKIRLERDENWNLYQESEKKSKELRNQVAELEGKIAGATTRAKTAEEKYVSLVDRMAEKLGSVADEGRILERIEIDVQELDSATKKFVSLEREYNKLQIEKKQEIKSLQDEVKQLKSDNEVMSKRLKRLESRAENLSESVKVQRPIGFLLKDLLNFFTGRKG